MAPRSQPVREGRPRGPIPRWGAPCYLCSVALPSARHPLRAPGAATLEARAAGPFSRLAASLLDHLVLVGVASVLAIPLQQLPQGGMGARLLLALALFLHAGYFALLEARDGRTPGKLALGLRVLTTHGRPPTLRTAFLRNLTRILWLPPGPGLAIEMLLALGESTHRRAGDLLARCLVVREPAPGLASRLLVVLPDDVPPAPEEARVPRAPDEVLLRRWWFGRARMARGPRERLEKRLARALDPAAPPDEAPVETLLRLLASCSR